MLHLLKHFSLCITFQAAIHDSNEVSAEAKSVAAKFHCMWHHILEVKGVMVREILSASRESPHNKVLQDSSKSYVRVIPGSWGNWQLQSSETICSCAN